MNISSAISFHISSTKKVIFFTITSIVICSTNCFGITREEVESDIGKYGLDAVMQQISAIFNKSTPLPVNEKTHIRHWSYSPKTKTMFIMYVVDHNSSGYTKEDINSYRQFSRQIDIDRTCADIRFRIPMEHGVSYNHSYEYVDGKFMMSYIVNISQCN
jgi:hypothetical protein